jgi:hypothetical protein
MSNHEYCECVPPARVENAGALCRSVSPYCHYLGNSANPPTCQWCSLIVQWCSLIVRDPVKVLNHQHVPHKLLYLYPQGFLPSDDLIHWMCMSMIAWGDAFRRTSSRILDGTQQLAKDMWSASVGCTLCTTPNCTACSNHQLCASHLFAYTSDSRAQQTLGMLQQ